jgi:hypothetical protein
MSPSTAETALTLALKGLDQREMEAYRYVLKVKSAEIAEDTAERMYEMFLAGKTCEDIRKINKGYSLGQIVACRIKYGWDARVLKYQEMLQLTVPDRAIQTTLETVDFISKLLTVNQMRMSEAIDKYMLTRNEEDLKGVILVKNAKELKELVELLMKTTGQDKKRIEFSGKVNVVQAQTGAVTSMSSADADAIARQLLGEKIIDVTEAPTPSSGPK